MAKAAEYETDTDISDNISPRFENEEFVVFRRKNRCGSITIYTSGWVEDHRPSDGEIGDLGSVRGFWSQPDSIFFPDETTPDGKTVGKRNVVLHPPTPDHAWIMRSDFNHKWSEWEKDDNRTGGLILI